MTLTNYQVPVWSVIFGSIFLGEILPVTLFIALGLILLGLAMTQKNIFQSIFSNARQPKV